MSAAVQPQLYQQSSPYQQPLQQPSPSQQPVQPAVQVVKVDVPAPGQQIVYARNCSIGLGITLIVLGCLLLVLGIVENAIPPFASRGSIYAVQWVPITAGAIGISAGRRVCYKSVRCSMIGAIICAVLTGLGVVLMIARIIIVIIVIPLANGEGPRYEYIWDHEYFDNGTIKEYDYDPEMIPLDRPWDDVDYLATGIVFAVEIVILLVACIIAIILSGFGCKSVCCGVKVLAPVMVMQPDGTLAPATVGQAEPLKKV